MLGCLCLDYVQLMGKQHNRCIDSTQITFRLHFFVFSMNILENYKDILILNNYIVYTCILRVSYESDTN